MSDFAYIHIITSKLKEKLEFPNFLPGTTVLTVKYINESLNHEVRCRKEDIQVTKDIIKEKLENHKLNGYLEYYEIKV